MDSTYDFELPSELISAWLAATLGPHEYLRRFSHTHQKSHLWRIRTASGNVWLKVNSQWGKWAAEVHSLRHWAPELGKSPTVIGCSEENHALLLSEVEGQIATEIDLSESAERRLWQAAGDYQAQLHKKKNDWLGATRIDGSPQGGTSTDPVSFVRGSIETRLRQGVDRGHWTGEEQKFIAHAMETWCLALDSERPTAIHRDFGPRNWLTNEAGDLVGVIDWEHSRWDVLAADLNRAWDDTFLTQPWLADAFSQGYGRLEEKLRQQIQALRLMGAVAGIVWSIEVGDDAYARLNREALHRLMA